MEEFRQQLINCIGGAQLSPEAVYYIVKDVYRDVKEEYSYYLTSKKEKEQESKEEETNDN